MRCFNDSRDTACFCNDVYDIVRQIPAGRVLTYGDIARLAGKPQCSRHVGKALAQVPQGVPCHRVVNGTGRTAPHWTEQPELLRAEKIALKPNGTVDLKQYRWEVLTCE